MLTVGRTFDSGIAAPDVTPRIRAARLAASHSPHGMPPLFSGSGPVAHRDVGSSPARFSATHPRIGPHAGAPSAALLASRHVRALRRPSPRRGVRRCGGEGARGCRDPLAGGRPGETGSVSRRAWRAAASVRRRPWRASREQTCRPGGRRPSAEGRSRQAWVPLRVDAPARTAVPAPASVRTSWGGRPARERMQPPTADPPPCPDASGAASVTRAVRGISRRSRRHRPVRQRR